MTRRRMRSATSRTRRAHALANQPDIQDVTGSAGIPPRPRPPHSRKTIQLIRFAVDTSQMLCCACLDALEHLTRGTFRYLCAIRRLCGQLSARRCVGLVLGARLGRTFVFTIRLVLLQLLGRRVGRTDRTMVNVDRSQCDNPQRRTLVRKI